MLGRIFNNKKQDRRPAKVEKKLRAIRKAIQPFGAADKICPDCGGSYSSDYVSCPRTALHQN